jgi:hypothetical protein
LLEPQFLIYDRVPSYWSGTPPSYHTVDRWNIYSCLESSINLDYIWIFCVFFLILILIWKFRMKIYFLKTDSYFVKSYFVKRDRR